MRRRRRSEEGRISVVFVLFAAVVAALFAPSEGHAASIAPINSFTPISAFRDHLVWSSYDATSNSYTLMHRFAGRSTALPVATRTVPFDVDLGPGTRGRTVAVYSRCAVEAKTRDVRGMPVWSKGSGCDIYMYDFGTAREQKVHEASSPRGSDFLPTIWKRRLAFARLYEARGDVAPYLYVRDLERKRSRRIRRGDVPSCGARCRLDDVTPSSLDLRGRHLAFGWQWTGGNYGFAAWELWLERIVDPRSTRTLVDRGVLGLECLTLPHSPVLDGGLLYWVRRQSGSEACRPPSSWLSSYLIGRGTRASALVPGTVAAFARGALRNYLLRSPVTVRQHGPEQDICKAPPHCELEESEALSWQRERRRKVYPPLLEEPRPGRRQ